MPYAERVVHIDTSDVRVTEWRLGPGASTRPRRHSCDCVIVPLTKGQLRVLRAEGDSSVEITPGASFLRTAPVEHDVINDGNDASLAFIEIELKDTARRLISG
jgi:beta-alanine degradation protein BauB